MNLTQFSRRGYVKTPTPLYRAERFSQALGGELDIWIKRDDLLPGAAGGNKTRKLDFELGKVIDEGHNCIITCGAPQSNHCRLTLSWAVREGLDCHLVLEERVVGSYDQNGSGNLLLYRLLGAKSVTVVPGGSDVKGEMDKVADHLRGEGQKPGIVPIGASTPEGGLGYVACAQELQEQMFNENLNIDSIVVASGSGGTQAGLIVGIKKNDMNIPVHGISVGKSTKEQTDIVQSLVDGTSKLLRMEAHIDKSLVMCDDKFIGPGYSLPSPEMIEAVELLAKTEAIILDPIYTGKAMAGLINYARNGRFPAGAKVLFLHTGGAPGLYAYSSVFSKENHKE